MDTITATTVLEQAREQFQQACVRAHRELAPSRECHAHHRFLGIPARPEDTLPPETRRHLAACAHCRYAADQLSRFDGGLDVLLAETVLGWGARRYADSRPGRTTPGPAERPHAPDTGTGTDAATGTATATGAGTDTESGTNMEPVRPKPRRRHRPLFGGGRHTTVVVGVGITSLALLTAGLVTKSWSDDDAVHRPGASGWAASSPRSPRARPIAEERPAASRPPRCPLTAPSRGTAPTAPGRPAATGASRSAPGNR